MPISWKTVARWPVVGLKLAAVSGMSFAMVLPAREIPGKTDGSLPVSTSKWSEKYGLRHHLEWIRAFPSGIVGPRKVRIYRRSNHFVLQWWDKTAKCNLSERIDGDLVAAITRARQIDERLENFRSSGGGIRKARHALLVEQFQADLQHRADAGEIDPRTAQRYEAALRHYLGFVEQPSIGRQFPHVSAVDRGFALELMAYLRREQVRPNGHPNGQSRPMRRPDYVFDVVRAMYEWAADPQRGKLIPEGFYNPFVRCGRSTSAVAAAPFGEPDITIDMAVDFLTACDPYQLRLFGPLAIYGMRAGEPCMLLHEHLGDNWLDVPCLLELCYFTKGRRAKRLPIIPAIGNLLRFGAVGSSSGLLYLRRGVVAPNKSAPLAGASYKTLVTEFQRRCEVAAIRTIADRYRARDQLLRDAGGITYDHIVGEFSRITRRLGWPASATIKDFRHLVATCLENSGMPEHYRRFILGQSPGRAAIVTYTHLNEVRQKFTAAVQQTLGPIVDAIDQRAQDLGLTPSPRTRSELDMQMQ
jgi:integrase